MIICVFVSFITPAIVRIVLSIKYNKYIFENIKLNSNNFLGWIECKHSWQTVWILVYVSFIFPIKIESEITIYRLSVLFSLLSLLLSSVSSTFILTFVLFNFFKTSSQISLFPGNFEVSSSNFLLCPASFIFFILMSNTKYPNNNK